MLMSEQEGVIKFKMEFAEAAALSAEILSELNAWRRVMVQMGMIGQTPERYDNYGFGNISCRLDPGSPSFSISGTQTGGIDHLLPEHFATVLECLPESNTVRAEGPMRPSSESMTHGMVYSQAPDATWVFHAHDPHIWQQATALGIPETAADVSYGSPEMSAEVVRLFAETDLRECKIFSMAGHEDGIVTFGNSAEEAGGVLLNYLAQAIAVGYK